MLMQGKFCCLLALVAAVSLTVGHVLPRPAKPRGDMLDAVAAVQRRCPLYITADRGHPGNWVTGGGVYLSRTSRTPAELDCLLKDSRTYDKRWDDVIYFKARDRNRELPFLPAPGDR